MSHNILMTDEHRNALIRNKPALMSYMKPMELVHLLQCRGVLTSWDMESIMSLPTNHERNIRIVDYLQRGPDSAYHEFVRALSETNQKHVVSLLERTLSGDGAAASLAGLYPLYYSHL